MAKDFHSEQVVDGYDDHIRKLIPGYEQVHAQVTAILETELQASDVHILIVGCGTGYELSLLLKQHPEWRYTAIDPSLTMINKARERLSGVTGAEQVSFLQGDTSVLNELMHSAQFDAALVILVAHFVPETSKEQFFKDIYTVLKPQAVLLTYDLMKTERSTDLKILQNFCCKNGLTQVQGQKMLERLQHDFELISAEHYVTVLKTCGFRTVSSYTQFLSYTGFRADK